jgi:cobalamin synthase
MNIDFYSLWQQLAFQIVHRTTLWLVMVLFGTALTSHFLALTLHKHNAREREAHLASKTAIGYTTLAIVLWLFSFIFA